MRTYMKRAALKDAAGNLVWCLVPADAASEADLAKLPAEAEVRADIVVPRNMGLHRKAFALLNLLYPHTNYPTMERLRAAMTIGAGFVDETVDPYTGNVVWFPKSWAFDSMDDLEFRELYSRLVDVALRLVPGSRRDDWEDAEQQIARM